MKYINPIFDRTADDVTNKTAKAYFNLVDWLRVYNNAEVINIIISFLLRMDITFNAVGTPSIATIPSVTDLNTLLANIERIRATRNLPEITGLAEIKANWGSGSASISPDYLDANFWEFAIDKLLDAVPSLIEYTVYCGVATAGQLPFYQKHFRQFQWVRDAESPVRRARTGTSTCGTGLTRNNLFRRYL
jgi:hypothetical protein